MPLFPARALEDETTRLVQALADKNYTVRQAATQVLGHSSHDPHGAALAAAAALRKDHFWFQQPTAFAALAQASIVDALADLSKSDDQYIAHIGSLLDWPFWPLRLRAIEALGKIRRKVSPASIDALGRIMRNPAEFVRLRHAAEDALAEILSADPLEDVMQ
jgi:HEAT repeat protein